MIGNDRTVYMSTRDSLRAGICERLVEKALSEEEAADRLGLSVRQVRRLKRRIKEAGPRGVIHRSRGRPSPRRISEAVQAATPREELNAILQTRVNTAEEGAAVLGRVEELADRHPDEDIGAMALVIVAQEAPKVGDETEEAADDDAKAAGRDQ